MKKQGPINLILVSPSQIQIMKWALKTNQSLINQIFNLEAITIKNKMKMMIRLVTHSQKQTTWGASNNKKNEMKEFDQRPSSRTINMHYKI